MKFKFFIIMMLFLAGVSMDASSQVKEKKGGNGGVEGKPNIVFILVDDLGYGDVGFNGATWHETPHIDVLAKESLVLENSYMYPTCSPSRTVKWGSMFPSEIITNQLNLF